MGKYLIFASLASIFLTYNLAQTVRWLHVYVVDGHTLALIPTMGFGAFVAAWGFLLSVYLREINKRY